jgi:hypothetical protein
MKSMWTWQSGKMKVDLAFLAKWTWQNGKCQFWQKHKITKENLAK